jgi:hypothetical protein
MSAGSATGKAGDLGRQADESPLLDKAVRVGLVSYGIVHLLIAWLAVQLAIGQDSGSASSSGALRQLAQQPLGRTLLYVVAVGFLALVLWQGIEAAIGHRDEEGRKRIVKRLVSAGRVVLYGSLGLSALRVAMGSGSSGGGTDSLTARLMSVPGGQVLVGLVGLGTLVVAGFLVYRGLKEKFLKKIDAEGQSGDQGRAFALFGKIGYVSKGVALAIIACLFIWAALTHDAQKSGGLDQAMHKVLQQPFGAPMLVVIALGIGCYGIWCFAWARHLDR